MKPTPAHALVTLLLIIAACGGGAEPPLGVVANAPGTLTINGPQRMLVGLLSNEAESLAAADRPAQIDVFVGEPDNVLGSVDATYIDTIPGVRGIYRFNVTFLDPGTYGLIVRAEGLPASGPVLFSVAEEGIVPDVGDLAPPSDTPTAADRPLAEISSDPNPEPRFYELSVADAVASGRPSVIVFSTPAWCQTASCGPTLEFVKEVAATQSDVNFVHVEVYENLDAERFEDLIVAPAVTEWGLPSEPWVFVVNGDGTIAATFEGAIDPAELAAALP